MLSLPQSNSCQWLSALCWRKNHYDFVFVSLTDVIFVQYLCRIYRKLDPRRWACKFSTNPIEKYLSSKCVFQPQKQAVTLRIQQQNLAITQNISHYSPAWPFPVRTPPPIQRGGKRLQFGVGSGQNHHATQKPGCLCHFPLGFRGIFWQTISAKLQ